MSCELFAWPPADLLVRMPAVVLTAVISLIPYLKLRTLPSAGPLVMTGCTARAADCHAAHATVGRSVCTAAWPHAVRCSLLVLPPDVLLVQPEKIHHI